MGAPYRYYAALHDEDPNTPPPSACLLKRRNGLWTLSQTLAAEVPFKAEGFGRSVALGPSFAAVGAPGYENGDGPAHAFERAAGGALRARGAFDSPERGSAHESVFAEFGVAVALDERFLLVGAPLESEFRNGAATCSGGGAVYVFDRGAGPALVATLRGSRPNENFGSSLAFAGDLLIVGAAGWYSGAPLAGAVHVYRREAPDRWRELCRIEGEGAVEKFGGAVAIDGARFAVSAPSDAILAQPPVGRVDLFEIQGDACRKLTTLRESAGFGAALALCGNRLAIGQPMYEGTHGPRQTGRVGLFRIEPGGAAHLEGWCASANSKEYARLGSSVALGPDYVAAGAPGLGEDADGSGFVIVKNW